VSQGRRSPSNNRRQPSPSNSRTPSPSLSMLAAANVAGRRSPSHHHHHHASQQGRHRTGRSPDLHHEGQKVLARSKSRTRRISSRSQDSPSGDKQNKSSTHSSSLKPGSSGKHSHNVQHQRSSSADMPGRKNSDSGSSRGGSKYHSRSASAENPSSKRVSPSEAVVTLDDAVLLNSSRHTSSLTGKGTHAEDLRAVQAQMQQKAAEVIASSTAGSVQFSGRRLSARQEAGSRERAKQRPPQDAMTQTLCNAMTQANLSDEDELEHGQARVIIPTPRDNTSDDPEGGGPERERDTLSRASLQSHGGKERAGSASSLQHYNASVPAHPDAEVRGLGLANSDASNHRKQSSPGLSKTQSPLEGVVNNVEDMALEEIEMLEKILQRRKSQLRGATGNDDGSYTVVRPKPQHSTDDGYSEFRAASSPKHAWQPSRDYQTGGESAVEQRGAKSLAANIKRMDSLENLAEMDRQLEHHHQQLLRQPLHGINEHDIDDIEPDHRSFKARNKSGHATKSSSTSTSHRQKMYHKSAFSTQADHYRKSGGADCPNTKMFSSAMDEEIKRLFLEYGDLERALEVQSRQQERERYHHRHSRGGSKQHHDTGAYASYSHTDPRHHDRMPTHGRRPHPHAAYHQDPQRRRASCGGGYPSSRSHRSSSPSSSYISSEGMSCVMVSPRSPHTEFGYQPPPSFVPRIRLEALRSPRPDEEDFRSPDLAMSIGVLSSPRSAFTPRSNTSNSSTSTPRPLY